MLDIWELRRSPWTVEHTKRALAGLAAWLGEPEPSDDSRLANRPPEQTDDDILAAELLLRLDAMPAAMVGTLAELVAAIEMPRFPEPLAPVVAALERDDLAALQALGGDPVDHVVAVLGTRTADERTRGNVDPDPTYVDAIKMLAALGTERALGVLLSMYSATDHDSVADTIAEAVCSMGANALDPSLALWPSLDANARSLVVDTLADAGIDDDRIWARLAGWLDETSGDAVSRLTDMIVGYLYPRDRDRHPRLVQAESFLRQRLERAHAADDQAAVHEIRWALRQVTGYLQPPAPEPTEAEREAQELARLMAIAREGDLAARLQLAEPFRRVPADVQATLARDPSADVRRALAGHPDLTSPMKEILAADPEVQVRRQIALHAGEDLAHRMLDDADPTVRVTFVRACPADDLERLAQDPDPRIRAQVADHGAVTLPILRRLATDLDATVREQVVYSRRAPRSLLRQLTADPDPGVAKLAARYLERDWPVRLCECCGQDHDAAA